MHKDQDGDGASFAKLWQKGQMQQKNNYMSLKEYNHSMPQSVDTEGPSPVKGKMLLEHKLTLLNFFIK